MQFSSISSRNRLLLSIYSQCEHIFQWGELELVPQVQPGSPPCQASLLGRVTHYQKSQVLKQFLCHLDLINVGAVFAVFPQGPDLPNSGSHWSHWSHCQVSAIHDPSLSLSKKAKGSCCRIFRSYWREQVTCCYSLPLHWNRRSTNFTVGMFVLSSHEWVQFTKR